MPHAASGPVGHRCQTNRRGDLLGEVAGGVEVFTKEAHLAFDLAGDHRAALTGDQLHAALDDCGPDYGRHLALFLAALFETNRPCVQYQALRKNL